MKHLSELSPFFNRYSLDETIDVLDDIMLILVQHTDLKGIENPFLIYQYTLIKELRGYLQLLENISNADQE